MNLPLLPLHDDFAEQDIGGIGNYYGGLVLKREAGTYYWGIVDWDHEAEWEEVPAMLGQALRITENRRRRALNKERAAQ